MCVHVCAQWFNIRISSSGTDKSTPKAGYQMSSMIPSSSMGPARTPTSQTRASSAGPQGIYPPNAGMQVAYSMSQSMQIPSMACNVQDLRRRDVRESEHSREAHLRMEGGHPSPVQSHYPHVPQYVAIKENCDDVKDLSRRVKEGPENYRGDPRDYDPRDPRFQEGHRKMKDNLIRRGVSPPPAPPPAHSNHPKQHADTNALYQLAEAATGQHPVEVHRPHSEPRSRSPYFIDRSQATPPALHPSSPYGYPAGAEHPVFSQRSQVPKSTIGQPPPLITVKDTKPPGISQKDKQPAGAGVMPAHAGGSITQGTPLNQPAISQPPCTRTGSISMGTPRYDAQQSRQMTPPHSRGEGSITKGMPVYEGGPDHRTPVTLDSGVLRMPVMLDPAALSRGAVVYTEQAPGIRMPVIYTPAELEIYQRSGMPGFMPGIPFPGNFDPSSTTATLMDDFMTAKMMQHEEKRRSQPEADQPSPRHHEINSRDPAPSKPLFPHGVTGGPPLSVPYSIGSRIVYLSPEGLPPVPSHSSGRQGNERLMNSGEVKSPHTSETGLMPKSWPHTQVKSSSQSPNIVHGTTSNVSHHQDRLQPTPPNRQNVIQPSSEKHHSVIRETRHDQLSGYQIKENSGNDQKCPVSGTYVEVARSSVDPYAERRKEVEYREKEHNREQERQREIEWEHRRYFEERAHYQQQVSSASREMDKGMKDRISQLPPVRGRPSPRPGPSPSLSMHRVRPDGSPVHQKGDTLQNMRNEEMNLKRRASMISEVKCSDGSDSGGKDDKGSESGDGSGNPTFTAAVLIDLIITNQINQQKVKESKSSRVPISGPGEKRSPGAATSPQHVKSSTTPTTVSSSPVPPEPIDPASMSLYGRLPKAMETDRGMHGMPDQRPSIHSTTAPSQSQDMRSSLANFQSSERNKSVSSLADSMSSQGTRTITLGQHINAIITQDFQGNSQLEKDSSGSGS